MYDYSTLVIKVGSALVANEHAMNGIALFVQSLQQQQKQVIIVSSGAVTAGRQQLGFKLDDTIIAKQALAAVGQVAMIARWQARLNRPCAQLLVSHQDFHQRTSYLNIRNTARELLSHTIVPIFNENDSVATAELKFGDNDNLAALVAIACDADALLILSDIDALYTAPPAQNPDATPIKIIEHINHSIWQMAGGSANKFATGGMTTKIQAAEKATLAGIDCFILQGSDQQALSQWVNGDNPGSLFMAQETQQNARQKWLYRGLRSQGSLEVDAGAEIALVTKGASLLAVGITQVHGRFVKGDAVDVVNSNGELIGRGICQYSADDVSKIKGLSSDKLKQVLGYAADTITVHRDDFVRAQHSQTA